MASAVGVKLRATARRLGQFLFDQRNFPSSYSNINFPPFPHVPHPLRRRPDDGYNEYIESPNPRRPLLEVGRRWDQPGLPRSVEVGVEETDIEVKNVRSRVDVWALMGYTESFEED